MLLNEGKGLFFQEKAVAIKDTEQHMLLPVCKRDAFQKFGVFLCTILFIREAIWGVWGCCCAWIPLPRGWGVCLFVFYFSK